jgi:hypothetical protein
MTDGAWFHLRYSLAGQTANRIGPPICSRQTNPACGPGICSPCPVSGITQRLVTPPFSEMDHLLPDLSLRQPSVITPIPLFLIYYTLAVLAGLPKTFFLKLLLQPIFVWQAWRCVVDADFAAWLAQSLGFESAAHLNFCNSPFAVRPLFIMLVT